MGLIMLTLLEIAALPVMLALFLAVEILTTAIALLCPTPLPYLVNWRAARADRESAAPGRRDEARPPATGLPARAARPLPEPGRSKVRIRRIGIVVAVIFAASLAAVVVADVFYFQSLVRATLAGVARSTGLRIVADQVRGSFLKGELNFANLEVTRGDGDSRDVQLQIDRLDIDLDMRAAVFGQIVISSLNAAGVEGKIVRKPAEAPRVPRRNIVVRHVCVSDAHVQVETAADDAPTQTWPIMVSRFEGGPIRRRWAAVDVLTNCAGTASVAGCPIVIEQAEAGGSSAKRWSGESLPVEFAGLLLGPPLRWCSSGTVSGAFVFRADDEALTCGVQVSAAGLTCDAARASTGGRLARTACALLNRLVRDRQPLEAEYEVEIPRKSLDGVLSMQYVGLWQRLASGFEDTIARLSGADPATVREPVENGKLRLRESVERARGKLSLPGKQGD